MTPLPILGWWPPYPYLADDPPTHTWLMTPYPYLLMTPHPYLADEPPTHTCLMTPLPILADDPPPILGWWPPYPYLPHDTPTHTWLMTPLPILGWWPPYPYLPHDTPTHTCLMTPPPVLAWWPPYPYLADDPPTHTCWWPPTHTWLMTPYPYLADDPPTYTCLMTPPPHGWMMFWVKLDLVLYVWRQDRMRPAQQGLPFIYQALGLISSLWVGKLHPCAKHYHIFLHIFLRWLNPQFIGKICSMFGIVSRAKLLFLWSHRAEDPWIYCNNVMYFASH